MLLDNVINSEDLSYIVAFDRELIKKRQNYNSIDGRCFLICDCCYWCSSYLPDFVNGIMQHFDKCPMCNEETTSMLISENASKRLDYNHIQNMMVESENWVI
jgi:hypothetical protein